jgi:uncharacterized protein YPO0396
MDIVERLRQEIAGYTDGPIEAAEATMHEAANEIERLRNKVQWLEMCENTVVKQNAEIERLRGNMYQAMHHATESWKENGQELDDQLGVVALILANGLGIISDAALKEGE